jgi:diguanylate cyclase (GGDEF)-like protein/PAS domain S-box-containing protein
MDNEHFRILVIEDDESVANSLARQLFDRRYCFDTECAGSLETGLERLARGGIDIVLLDLGLPDCQGFDTFIRLHEREPNVPVVILTGCDDDALALQTLEHGAQDYLLKGQIDGETFIRSIRYGLERHRLMVKVESQARTIISSEARYRHMIEKNADGIIIVDRQGLVQYANPAAERLLRRRKQEILGETFGFPLVAGEKTEIDLIRGTEEPAVAEMHVVETEWKRQAAYLVSLRDMTELAQLREKLQAMSVYDELAGLYNRRGLLTLAQAQMNLAQRTKRGVLVFFVDVDNLKAINDVQGHAEGDGALVATAEILRQTFRKSDIISRLGGDEFAVLAVEANANEIDTIKMRLGKTLLAHNAEKDQEQSLSVSVGAVRYDGERFCAVEDLLAQADKQMYKQKKEKHAARDKWLNERLSEERTRRTSERTIMSNSSKTEVELRSEAADS